jgi:DNA-directed RNA polymerase specialized sigma24 family protein
MDAAKERNEKADVEPMADMTDATPPVHFTAEDFEAQALETHLRRTRRERSHHIDLSKEEYAPDEIARMLGTSLEVVMQAIWHGQLKAERKGQDVVCIQHADVVDWLKRRGPGV